MSRNLRKCLKSMHLYCNTKCPKLKKSMINEISTNNSYFKALHEILHNINVKKIKLKASDKRKLKKHVTALEKILSNPKSKARRISAVKQTGGAWPLLLSLAAPLISEVINYAISKANSTNSS